METKYNINVVMCEKADTDTTQIKNIFNTIKCEKGGESSFDIVTFINIIGHIDDFNLLYILEHDLGKQNNPRAALLKVEYTYQKEEKSTDSDVECSQKFNTAHFEGMHFDGVGNYTLKVYLYKREEWDSIQINDPESFEKRIHELEDSHLACIYFFEVVE